jgi:anti-anti-sigma regulatory factor
MADHHGGALVLADCTPAVEAALRRCKLHHVFEIVPKSSAVRHLGAIP